MTKEQLETCTRKTLAEMARDKGVPGWHAMKKQELLDALSPKKKQSRKSSAKSKTTRASTKTQRSAARNTTEESEAPAKTNGNGKGNGRAPVPTKDLSEKMPRDLPQEYGKDRIVLMVRDPYWLHCYWEITRHAVQRAEAALAQEWYHSKPILRLLDVTSQDTSGSTETVVRDIVIHGGCNNWYIDVPDPPRSWRIDIGYLAPSGKFYVVARSNVVVTPRAGMSDTIDENWADIDSAKAERIYAMSGGFDPTASSLELKQLFEERLRRPLGSPAITSFGSGSYPADQKDRSFWFQLDAELIVYGATDPQARVTLQGEPVQLRPDGTFTMRFSLPDSRQIIPAVATSPDGVEERTIVLAVERNTKHLEPMIHENNE